MTVTACCYYAGLPAMPKLFQFTCLGFELKWWKFHIDWILFTGLSNNSNVFSIAKRVREWLRHNAVVCIDIMVHRRHEVAISRRRRIRNSGGGIPNTYDLSLVSIAKARSVLYARLCTCVFVCPSIYPHIESSFKSRRDTYAIFYAPTFDLWPLFSLEPTTTIRSGVSIKCCRLNFHINLPVDAHSGGGVGVVEGEGILLAVVINAAAGL